MTRKIGVLGSAFDPPTLGHMDVVDQVLPHVDQLLLVPSAAHAFAKQMTPFADRVAMLQAWVEEQALAPRVEICTLEARLWADSPGKPVYTFDLLDHLEQQYQAAGERVELVFVRGPDNADPTTWQRFYRADEIMQRWTIMTAKERLAVRSSKVRALCAETRTGSALAKALSGYVAASVIDYIMRQRLYRVTLENNVKR